jgi:hypothetical protein
MKTYNVTVIVLAIILIIANNSFASTVSNANDSYTYVLDLTPSKQLHELYIASKPEFNNYKLYTIRRETPATLRYDIRLGFFKSREQAQNVLSIVEKYNISGTVDTVKSDELPIVAHWRKQLVFAAEEVEPVAVEHLMKLADQAMRDKNYVKAIGLYTKVINSENNNRQQIAQEKLAIARERNNQLAHARAEYQVYLDRYPGGEGAIRVKRRLNRLISQHVPADDTPDLSLASAQEPEWLHNGNVYQFYHRNIIEVNDEESFTSDSLISTNINYVGRTLNNPSPMEVNISATQLHDRENSDDDETRVALMYFDMTSESRLFDIRMGRQKSKNTNIYNRFDGIETGYMISQDLKAKLTLGFPVEYNETVENSRDKYFYSAGISLFPDRAGWNANLYYIEQMADRVLDRREVAFDARYQSQQTI